MNETLYNFGRDNNLDFDSLDILADLLKRRELNYTKAIQTCLKKLTNLEIQSKITFVEYDDAATFEVGRRIGLSVTEHTVMVFLVKALVYSCEPEVQKAYLRMVLSLLVSLKQSHLYFLNPDCGRGKRFFDTVLAVGPDFNVWKTRVEQDISDMFEDPRCDTESVSEDPESE